MTQSAPQHIPVLLNEVLELCTTKKSAKILDVTLGLGGHSVALFSRLSTRGFLIGLDADKTNLTIARERLGSQDRCLCIHSNFRKIPDCLPEEHRRFDFILADLGLSSPHVDDPGRGFSFRGSSRLDMRFDQSRGLSALHYLQSTDLQKLIQVFAEFGELPKSHLLAREIQRRRSEHTLRDASDLRSIAETVYRRDVDKRLPQIFQALRIAVNDECGSLDHLLAVAPTLLAPGGRFAVISYHSLEDRRVKHAFKARTEATKDPLTGQDIEMPHFTLLTKKVIKPCVQEVQVNPRSRSAVLRAIQKNVE